MTYSCLKCSKEYNTRGGLSKHNKKCDKKVSDEQQEVIDILNNAYFGDEIEEITNEDKVVAKNDIQKLQQQQQINISPNDIEALRNELTMLFINNPTINLTKKVETNYMELINKMSIEELKIRILEIKQNLSTKLDRRYSDMALKGASFLVGSVLGISNELEKVNSADELLSQSAQELLTFRLGLFALPAEVKTSGLFFLNVVDTFIQKQKELQKQRDSEEVIRKALDTIEKEEQKEVVANNEELPYVL